MSSILAIDPEILLIGLAMPLGVALIVGMAAWRKRNGDGQRHVEERHVEERHVEERHVEEVPEKAIGFASIDEKLDEILALLGKQVMDG